MLRKQYKTLLRRFLSREIRKYRTQCKLTQEQISERLCMAPRSYADLEHGACGCAGLTVVLFLLLLTAYINRGETPAVTGALGLIIMIAGWFGVAIGVRGLREIEKDYRSCRVGIVLNGILAFSLTALFLGGLF